MIFENKGFILKFLELSKEQIRLKLNSKQEKQVSMQD